MKFYKIRNSGSWGAMHTDEIEEKLKLGEKIFLDQFWEDPVTIPMMLRNGWEEEEGNPPVIQDFYLWQHSLALDTYPQPAGKLMIISSKVKQVFEELSIPSHRYYKADIPNGGGGEYFVFQVLFADSIIDYSQTSCYIYENITNKLIKRLEVGEVKNIIDFKSRRTELLKEDKNINFDEFHFDKHYDIIPVKTAILASERAKQAIEKAGCKGFEFLFEYNKTGREIPIFMPEVE